MLNYEKVSRYYELDCLQNFNLLFISLSTASVFKNNHILSGIYYIFLKNVIDQTWKAFITIFWFQWKDRESSNQVIQILALFCKLVALKEFGAKLEAKQCFQRQSLTKYLRQTPVFLWNSALKENLNFYTSPTKFRCWNEDWAQGKNSMKFWDFRNTF